MKLSHTSLILIAGTFCTLGLLPTIIDRPVYKAALLEGDLSEAAYPAGFGPGRFYDIAGFIENGRRARFTQLYFDQPGPVYRLDSVGCCYLVNADLYRWGAKQELDIAENRDWPEDATEQNQSGPANSFTDHYSVCEFARKVAVPVQAFADLLAFHQRA